VNEYPHQDAHKGPDQEQGPGQDDDPPPAHEPLRMSASAESEKKTPAFTVAMSRGEVRAVRTAGP
jgi:hypothetical protein